MLWLTFFAALAAAQNNSIISIPQSLTYYIPASNFSSVLTYEWANGTTTTNATTNSLLRNAAGSTFISYSNEFLNLIGDSPQISSIYCPNASLNCAFESGVWLPDINEVWFSPPVYGYPNQLEGLYGFNLNSNSSRKVPINQTVYANGGYLFGPKAWFASNEPNGGVPSSIYSVDTRTLEVEELINSYFGIPFPSVDEPVWVTRGNDSYLFFTGVSFQSFLPNYPMGNLSNAVWRFDAQTHVLQPVIDRTVIRTPNGIRVSSDQNTLYVTNTEEISQVGAGEGKSSTGVPAIYKFDLTADAYPINGRIWGMARTGIPDGLHVDDAGRVWTGEGGGIVVRNFRGQVIGEVNMVALQHPTSYPIANFALAGNKLVIGAFNRVILIQLNETVVARNSSIIN